MEASHPEGKNKEAKQNPEREASKFFYFFLLREQLFLPLLFHSFLDLQLLWILVL